MLHIYKASAGSGKTFALTREYIRMLLSDKANTDARLPHSRILAVTFTKKSTAEMKERILKELYILANTPDKSDYINDFLNDRTINLNKEAIQQRAQSLLIGILQDYNRFSVSTIDGFFQQVLRTFAMELGLSTTYDLALDHNEVVNQAVDDIFKRIREDKSGNEDITNWLIEYANNNIDNNQSWNPNEPIKTFSTELSKERLMQQMQHVQDVFADKDKMRSYLEELKAISKQVPLQVEECIKEIKQALELFDTDDLNSTATKYFYTKKAEEIINKGLSTTVLKILRGESSFCKKSGKGKAALQALEQKCQTELLPLIEKLHNIAHGEPARNYITANAILEKLYSLGILQDVAAQIQNTNKKLGRLPISEINRLIYQIIDGQDAPFIYERIGQYYNHYMIDEFQDTSAMQWQNFRPLIEETDGRGQSNLIVGDVKQSIYRFRNSDWHLLNQVSQQFNDVRLGDGMKNNWRTAKVVVDNNEQLMQAYCQWVANEFKNNYDCDFEDQIDEISHIYSHNEMHQEARKAYSGYFHMHFFEGKSYKEQALETLLEQIRSFEEEKIDLSRVTILTRYVKDVENIAKFLIQNGYEVQSTGGLRISSHTAVQLVVHLLNLSLKHDDAADAFVHEAYPTIDDYNECITQAYQLPLYDQVQALIDGLQLNTWEGATPYLTAFQDKVFQFTQSKIADTQLFLEHWEQKGKDAAIPAPKTSSAINIMTIHSSKGLEFDIVMLPFFDWKLADTHKNDVIWCKPNVAPFDTLPLVPVKPKQSLVRSHLAKEYIEEELATYTDNLNITYVAITRPRHRLYIYGPKFALTTKNELGKINNVGQLISYLYRDQLDDQNTYSSLPDGDEIPNPLPPKEQQGCNEQASTYISTPIDKRLTLRSRSEDDFATDTPLAIVDLGILMHLWLSYIHTWDDAQPALQRMVIGGEVTQKQAQEMQEQLTNLQSLIAEHKRNDWFSNQYQVLAEQDIITPSGKTYRPDRIMIKDKHAIIVDYKFGEEQRNSYIEQIRGYILLLRQLGYTSEGYIVYNKIKIIQPVK